MRSLGPTEGLGDLGPSLFLGCRPFVGSLTLLSCLSTVPLPKPFQKMVRACHLLPVGTMTDTIWKGDKESSRLAHSHHEVRRGGHLRSLEGWGRGRAVRQGGD